MQDFTLMRPLVDKLCESLITEPENWDFEIWYITSPNHLGSIEIYMGTQNTFTETRSKKGSTHTETVFSYEQGKLIKKSLPTSSINHRFQKTTRTFKSMQPKHEVAISSESKHNPAVAPGIIILLFILIATFILTSTN